MKPIYVLNGPNLNRLGKREPEIYGTTTLAEIEQACRDAAGEWPIRFFQANGEEPLIDRVHEAIDEGGGIVINPAGLSFQAISLCEALKMVSFPIVEVHISNIHRRQPGYNHSLISTVATAVIGGFGARGYEIATGEMVRLLAKAC